MILELLAIATACKVGEIADNVKDAGSIKGGTPIFITLETYDYASCFNLKMVLNKDVMIAVSDIKGCRVLSDNKDYIIVEMRDNTSYNIKTTLHDFNKFLDNKIKEFLKELGK